MAKEKPESELKRLRVEQKKAQQDEVFGGLSPAERAAYNEKTNRINELEIELTARALAIKSSQFTKAEQKREWNKESETDTPQAEAHQPYRSRETDSTNASTNSLRKKRDKRKHDSNEKGSE